MAIDTISNTLSNMLAGRPAPLRDNPRQSIDRTRSEEANDSRNLPAENDLWGSAVTAEYPTYSRKSVAARQTSGEAEEPTAEQADAAKKEEELAKLRARDREVRNHEATHLAALGAYKKGGASFTTQTGPDGQQYAVGGEVPIDLSPEATPEATITKAQTIRQAALAPADPSPADRQVAAKATQMEAAARSELLETRDTGKNKVGPNPSPATNDQAGEGESNTPSATHLAAYRRALDYASPPSIAPAEHRTVNMNA